LAVKTELMAICCSAPPPGEHYNKLNREQCEIQCPKNGAAKDSSHLGCDNMLLGEEFSSFWRI